MTSYNALPDITRPDTGLVLTSELAVSRPEQQRVAADALIDVFERVAWPEGLLSHTVLLGTDGVSLQHYAQWKDDAAYEAFQRNDPPERLAYILDAAPDLKRVRSGHYTLYRSAEADTDTPPGCIVIVSIEFEGPDAARQRAWVDAVFDAIASIEAEPPGSLGAHFHVSTDGTRVINYAEWVDEASHANALDPGGRVGGGPLWDRVRQFPGLKHGSFKRFTPYRGQAMGQSGNPAIRQSERRIAT